MIAKSLLLMPSLVSGHGEMTQPQSATGGSKSAGNCIPATQYMCSHMWYENGTMIPGEPTIDEYSPLRTTKNCPEVIPGTCEHFDNAGNAKCCYGSEGLEPGKGKDTQRKSPWRAPGTAPIT